MPQRFNNLLAMWRKPFYAAANVFSPSTDLSWIPDAPAAFTFAIPLESADGVISAFTFENIPKVAYWNGVGYFENHGFTRTGNVISFTNEVGTIVAPEAGATIRAIY